MSEITLIIIHRNHVTIKKTHWRTAKQLLQNIPHSSQQHEYLIIDTARKCIINAQTTFTLPPQQLELLNL